MANDMVNLSSASISSVVSGDTSGRKAAQPLVEPSDSSALSSNGPATAKAVDTVQSGRETEPKASAGTDPKAIAEAQRKEAEKQAQNLQEVSELKGWNVSFRVDNDLDKTIIKVVDADTDKMIRQIPSEELLTISKRIQALRDGDDSGSELSGLLFDRKV